jgi:hypothetical protein
MSIIGGILGGGGNGGSGGGYNSASNSGSNVNSSASANYPNNSPTQNDRRKVGIRVRATRGLPPQLNQWKRPQNRQVALALMPTALPHCWMLRLNQ